METRSLRQNSPTKNSFCQAFAPSCQCVHTSSDQTRSITNAARKHNVHCSLLQILQRLGLSHGQARVPYRAGIFKDWANHRAVKVQQIIQSCSSPFKLLFKNTNTQWQTGYSPRPPTSSDRNEILRGGWSWAVLRFEFRQNRLSGFGAVGVEVCPSLLTWPLAYITACTIVQAVIPVKLIIAQTRHTNARIMQRNVLRQVTRCLLKSYWARLYVA